MNFSEEKQKKIPDTQIADSKPSNNSKNTTAIIVLLIIALIRLLILFNTSNMPGDPTTRLMQAKYISTTWPIFIEHSWLPLYFYFTGFLLTLFSSPLFVRTIFVCMTIVSLYLYYNIIKKLFEKTVAILSLMFIGFCPMSILYSNVTFAHAPFYFFLILSFYLLMKYHYNNKKGFLIFSAFFLSISCGFRYEGWFFFIPLILILPVLTKKKSNILIYFFILAIVPIIWILQNYHYTDNILQFVELFIIDPSAREYTNNSIIRQIVGWRHVFFRMYSYNMAMSLVFLALFIVGFVRCYFLNKKQLLQLLAIFIVPLLFIIFFTGTPPALRKVYWIKLLFTPFLSLGIVASIKYLKIFGKYLSILLISYYLVNSAEVLVSYYNQSNYFNTQHDSFYSLIKANLTDSPPIIIDDWNWQGVYMISKAAFNYGYAGFSYGITEKKVYYLPGYTNYGFEPEASKLEKFIKEKKPEYMIYAFKGKLPGVFGFSGNEVNEEYFGVKFQLLAKSPFFGLYIILYPQEGI